MSEQTNTHINNSAIAGSTITTGRNNKISTTIKDINQTITSMPQAGIEEKKLLEKLVQQLEATLQKAPLDRQEEAEAIAETLKDLLEKSAKESPNKTSIKISAEGLKNAAAKLKDVLADVLPIATQIAMCVLNLVR